VYVYYIVEDAVIAINNPSATGKIDAGLIGVFSYRRYAEKELET